METGDDHRSRYKFQDDPIRRSISSVKDERDQFSVSFRSVGDGRRYRKPEASDAVLSTTHKLFLKDTNPISQNVFGSVTTMPTEAKKSSQFKFQDSLAEANTTTPQTDSGATVYRSSSAHSGAKDIHERAAQPSRDVVNQVGIAGRPVCAVIHKTANVMQQPPLNKHDRLSRSLRVFTKPSADVQTRPANLSRISENNERFSTSAKHRELNGNVSSGNNRPRQATAKNTTRSSWNPEERNNSRGNNSENTTKLEKGRISTNDENAFSRQHQGPARPMQQQSTTTTEGGGNKGKVEGKWQLPQWFSQFIGREGPAKAITEVRNKEGEKVRGLDQGKVRKNMPARPEKPPRPPRTESPAISTRKSDQLSESVMGRSGLTEKVEIKASDSAALMISDVVNIDREITSSAATDQIEIVQLRPNVKSSDQAPAPLSESALSPKLQHYPEMARLLSPPKRRQRAASILGKQAAKDVQDSSTTLSPQLNNVQKDTNKVVEEPSKVVKLTDQPSSLHPRDLNSFLRQQRKSVLAFSTHDHTEVGYKILLSGHHNSLSSVVSTICFAWLLQNTDQNRHMWRCIPVINYTRQNMSKNKQPAWLLQQCGLEMGALLFSDEIDVAKIVQSGRGRVGIAGQDFLSTNGEVASCCTILAEMYADHAPQLLKSFHIKSLLLAGLLLDTNNFNASTAFYTARDKAVAALCEDGAGPYGRVGFFNQLTILQLKEDPTNQEMFKEDY